MQQWRKHPNPNDSKTMATVCKHPRVRIVSRHDDAEFVECLECGEVFDSEEFHDMEIEETVETEQAESEYCRQDPSRGGYVPVPPSPFPPGAPVFRVTIQA